MTSLSKTLSTAFGLILVGSAIAIPPPEGGFIDEDHKQRYTHHGNQLRAFEERYVEEIEPLKSTLRQALEVRLLELSTTTNPARIRELHKTTSEWFKEDGSLEISAEIPAELASEVTSYRTSVARRTEARDRSIAKEHHWLVRQLDQLALKFEEKGDLETMRALRKEARALMPTAGLKPTNYGQLELTAYNWHWQHFPFVRMQRVEGEQELISSLILPATLPAAANGSKLKFGTKAACQDFMQIRCKIMSVPVPMRSVIPHSRWTRRESAPSQSPLKSSARNSSITLADSATWAESPGQWAT